RLLQDTARTSAQLRQTPPDRATGTLSPSGNSLRIMILAKRASSVPACVSTERASASPESAADNTTGKSAAKSGLGEAFAASTNCSRVVRPQDFLTLFIRTDSSSPVSS